MFSREMFSLFPNLALDGKLPSRQDAPCARARPIQLEQEEGGPRHLDQATSAFRVSHKGLEVSYGYLGRPLKIT